MEINYYVPILGLALKCQVGSEEAVAMPTSITASMLYDLVQCPHRVTMDLFGAPKDRDEITPFIQLLWEKGALHEQNVIGDVDEPFLDLSIYAGEEKERLTAEAMARGEPLIYGGRIAEDDLLGDPDLLRKQGDGYVAGDIKSGAGLEGSEDLSKPKIHYAVQIALYTDILERKGLSGGRIPFIWDVHGDEVVYALDEPQGVRNPVTLWSTYLDALNTARQLIARSEVSLPAYSSTCRLCHWYSACQKSDLSPVSHPGISRVRSAFEPVWLGGATGRGVEPPASSSAPSRCVARALCLA
jgi:predicted RecB family nuclease